MVLDDYIQGFFYMLQYFWQNTVVQILGVECGQLRMRIIHLVNKLPF
jgi:hypothetical protein